MISIHKKKNPHKNNKLSKLCALGQIATTEYGIQTGDTLCTAYNVQYLRDGAKNFGHVDK